MRPQSLHGDHFQKLCTGVDTRRQGYLLEDGNRYTLGDLYKEMPPWVKYQTLMLRLQRHADPYSWQYLASPPMVVDSAEAKRRIRKGYDAKFKRIERNKLMAEAARCKRAARTAGHKEL